MRDLCPKANEIRYLPLTEDQFMRIATRFKFEYQGEIVPAVGMPTQMIERFDQLPDLEQVLRMEARR